MQSRRRSEDQSGLKTEAVGMGGPETGSHNLSGFLSLCQLARALTGRRLHPFCARRGVHLPAWGLRIGVPMRTLTIALIAAFAFLLSQQLTAADDDGHDRKGRGDIRRIFDV